MSPDELRRALFDAIARGDRATVERMLDEHGSLIVATFATWAKVPPEVRADPAALQVYANGLIFVADAFASGGRPELMEILRGGGAGNRDNPIERWQGSFREADGHMHAGRHRDAIAILEAAVREMATCTGTAVDAIRPNVLGMLGMAYFRIGDLTNAERRTREAHQDCLRTKDAEGARIYAQNLAAIARGEAAS